MSLFVERLLQHHAYEASVSGFKDFWSDGSKKKKFDHSAAEGPPSRI